MKKGDVILLPFPFTDLKGNKNRPAIVLFANDLDVTVCFITSELRWQSEFDITIEPAETNGLKLKSLIRITKIATVDIDLVLGELGYLNAFQIKNLNHNLKRLLKLD